MSVRPFYIDADIEGRKTPLAGGPRRADGSMHIKITQRNAVTLRQLLRFPVTEKVINLSPKFMTVMVLVWQHTKPITNR